MRHYLGMSFYPYVIASMIVLRSGSGNSDRLISGSLALKRPMEYGQRKEQEDEKDKTESLGKF
jgi:hypothetical protein